MFDHLDDAVNNIEIGFPGIINEKVALLGVVQGLTSHS